MVPSATIDGSQCQSVVSEESYFCLGPLKQHRYVLGFSVATKRYPSHQMPQKSKGSWEKGADLQLFPLHSSPSTNRKVIIIKPASSTGSSHHP